MIVLTGLLFLFARELGVFDDSAQRVKVANVQGEPYEDAKALLEGLGFEVRPDPIESDEPDGTVLRQDPAGDTLADEGSIVTLTYSQPADTIAVRDMVGQLEARAVAELERLGFSNVSVTYEEAEDPGPGRARPPPGTEHRQPPRRHPDHARGGHRTGDDHHGQHDDPADHDPTDDHHAADDHPAAHDAAHDDHPAHDHHTADDHHAADEHDRRPLRPRSRVRRSDERRRVRRRATRRRPGRGSC